MKQLYMEGDETLKHFSILDVLSVVLVVILMMMLLLIRKESQEYKERVAFLRASGVTQIDDLFPNQREQEADQSAPVEGEEADQSAPVETEEADQSAPVEEEEPDQSAPVETEEADQSAPVEEEPDQSTPVETEEEPEPEPVPVVAGKAKAMLVTTTMKKEVYTKLYQQAAENDCIVQVGYPVGEFPGEKGCVRYDQMRELEKQKWYFCLVWDGKGDLANILSKRKASLKKAKFAAPNAVYFAEGTYSAKYDEVLEKEGISIAIHHGEEGLPLASVEETGILHIGAVSVSSLEEGLSAAAAADGTVAIVLEEKELKADAGEGMFETLNQWQAEDKLEILAP